MTSNNQELDQGQVITFYSYKGGTGRTMALANVACLLAQQQQEKDNGGKILIIDWDLEAPGLHRYFRDYFVKQFGHQNSPEMALSNHPGLIELFEDLDEQIGEGISERDLGNTLESFSFEEYIFETDIPEIYFLKSGSFNESYGERVSTFNWVSIFERTEGLLFTLLAEQLSKEYKYILIDSRTGITDISNICTMLMPEKLVLVFTPNRQSLTGLEQLVKKATNYRRNSNDLRSLVIFPLPSRVELNESYLKEDWRFGNINEEIQGYQPTFEDLLQSVYSLSTSESRLQKYFDEVQIQQSTRFAYGEEIAVLMERSNDSLSLTRSYQRFFDQLLNKAPWSQQYFEPKLVISREMLIKLETLSSKASNLQKAQDLLGALMTILKAIIQLQQLELDIKTRRKQSIPKNVKNRLADILIKICNHIREKNRFEGHGDAVYDLDIHPTGKLIISGSQDRTVKLWKSDGELIRNFTSHEGIVRAVSFNHKGDLIISGGDDRIVGFWNLKDRDIKVFSGHQNHVLSVCFSPDDRLIASADADGKIILWHLDGTLIKIIDAHNDRIWKICSNPNVNFIASVSNDQTIKLWNLDGSLCKIFEDNRNKVYSISLSSNGQRIAAVGADQTIRIWDINDEKFSEIWAKEKAHESEIYCVSFNNDSSKIATASADKTIKLWNAINGELIENFQGHIDKVQSVLFDNVSQKLISTSNDATIRVWQIPDGQFSPPQQEELDLDNLLSDPTFREYLQFSCDWLDNYLRTNPNVSISDRRISETIRTIFNLPNGSNQ